MKEIKKDNDVDSYKKMIVGLFIEIFLYFCTPELSCYYA
jgi:hypothetical protein